MTNREAIQFLNNMIGEEHGRSIGADGFYRELCAYHVDALRIAIKALEQEPKTGHWIDHNNGAISCSYCHTWFNKDDRYSYMNHCPNCGAKMESEEQA